MDIQQLRHFLATVRHGNLSVAARTLHITVSGLSRSIKALEDSIGLPLFSRSPRGLEPSSHGLRLVPWAQAIVNQRDRALEEFAALRQARSGVLHFGVTMNFARSLAPQVVQSLLQGSPGLEITVTTGSQTELTGRLQASEIDFVFGTIRQRSDSPDLFYDPLMLSRSGVFCRPQHPYATLSGGVEASKLARADWALVDSSSSRQAFHEYFVSRNLPVPRLAACSNALEFLLELVQRTDLLTNLPEQLVEPLVREGRLVQLPCEPPTGHATVGFVLRVGHVVTPAMQAAIDWIRQRRDALYAEQAPLPRPATSPVAVAVTATQRHGT